MIDITVEQFNTYMINAGLLGSIIGILLLFGIVLCVQYKRRQYFKRYLQEQKTDKRQDIYHSLIALEKEVLYLANETNTTLFKSWYNDLQNILTFIKKKFV